MLFYHLCILNLFIHLGAHLVLACIAICVCPCNLKNYYEKKDVGDNFLDAVTSDEQPRAWTTKVLIGHWTLDTGAGVTAVSERVYQSLHPTTPLLKPTKVHGPDRKQLQVLGQFTHTLSHDKKTSVQQNLLGLPAITALQLDSTQWTTIVLKY